MTVELHFGVTEMPYSHSDNLGKVKKGRTQGRDRLSTTGEVAEKLEEKYGIFALFWEKNADKIVDLLGEGLAGSFESLMMGAPASPNVFQSGNAEVDKLFKEWLSTGEIEKLGVPGVPTKASIRRRSSRFKSGKGPSQRPSFIDTGLYESSARTWAENK
jgi:hypothetical protein